MKKVALLLSALFLFGCGAGGGTTTSSTGGSGGGGTTTTSTTTSAPLTAFTIQLQSPQASNKHAAYLNLSSVIGMTANYARVAVRQIKSVPHTTTSYPLVWDDISQTFIPDTTKPPVTTTTYTITETYRRVVTDILIDVNNKISFTTPVSIKSDGSDNYFFDVVTYKKGSPNVILQFATTDKTGKGIVVDGTTPLSLTLNPIAPIFTTPTSIQSLSSFTISTTAYFPLDVTYSYALQTLNNTASSAFTFPTANMHYPYIATGTITSTAPSVSSADATDMNLRFDAKFHIDSSMLDLANSQDSASNFVWFMPSVNIPFAPLVTITN